MLLEIIGLEHEGVPFALEDLEHVRDAALVDGSWLDDRIHCWAEMWDYSSELV